MKRLALCAATALALVLGAANAFAQGTFKIPFTFQAGGKSLPAGVYQVGPKDNNQLTLRRKRLARNSRFPSRSGWRSLARLSQSPSWSSMWWGISRRLIRNTLRIMS